MTCNQLLSTLHHTPAHQASKTAAAYAAAGARNDGGCGATLPRPRLLDCMSLRHTNHQGGRTYASQSIAARQRPNATCGMHASLAAKTSTTRHPSLSLTAHSTPICCSCMASHTCSTIPQQPKAVAPTAEPQGQHSGQCMATDMSAGRRAIRSCTQPGCVASSELLGRIRK